MVGNGQVNQFKGVFHDYEDGNYGGIAVNMKSGINDGDFGNGIVYNYGASLTENNEDYAWQLDSYFTGSYEFSLTPSTYANVGISISLNGLPYRMFFNDEDNKVSTAYSVGPIIGLRHQFKISQSTHLVPFAHYYYSSQSVSSSSLWTIFADAFTDPEKDRSVHDYRDVVVAGATVDFSNVLITPAYVKNNTQESWHIGLGVNF